LPISPLSGKLDAFVWTVPTEAFSGPVLEQVAQQALVEALAKTNRPASAAVSTSVAIEPVRVRPAARRKTDPVVAEPPLPDDPGPELERDNPQPRKRFRLLEWLAGSSP
jgi:HemY protein